MPRKAKLAKTLAITLAPIYIPILLLLYFGFRIETILAAILFAQIYIFIIQAEAMLRQAELSRAGYDTSFDINVGEISLSIPIVAQYLTETNRTPVEIQNTGSKPAYNFFVGARDESLDKPIPPEIEGSFTFNPTEKRTFFLPISTKEFKDHKIALIISYENVLGDLRDVQAISFEGSDNFFMMPLRGEPGFLVKAYQDLGFYIRWYFRYRKLKGFKRVHK